MLGVWRFGDKNPWSPEIQRTKNPWSAEIRRTETRLVSRQRVEDENPLFFDALLSKDCILVEKVVGYF